MNYEYDFVVLPLSNEQKQVVQMGLADVDQINAMLRTLINERTADGWEPLYPFSVPAVWFRRPKKKTRKTS